MLIKLQSLFPNAILFSSRPDNSFGNYHVFYDHSREEWIGIPKEDLSEKEVTILKTVFELVEPVQPDCEANSLAGSWREFLFSDGPLPGKVNGSYIRFIQFNLKGNSFEQADLESALKGFFSEESLILWESGCCGAVIETHPFKQQPLSEEELVSLAETLENDFYINLSFYYGKQYMLNSELRKLFNEEKEYFTFAQSMLQPIKFFSFERVFPAYMAFHLPEPVKEKLTKPIMEVFQEDPEIFSTIKAFLENNLNASLTSKKLFIHRNTLQYRVDKFIEKTGIQLKDFYGSFTVFLACLLFEKEHQPSNRKHK